MYLHENHRVTTFGGGRMFEIGEKIFYPMFGAGIVEAIEEKEILGIKQLYYILNMTLSNLQVMIPTSNMVHLEIREVVDSSILENALAIFHSGKPNITEDSKLRQRIHMDKMKSGDVYEGVQVICDLMSLNKKKKLGSADKIMLDKARQMLISELALVKGLNQQQAASLLNVN